MPLGDGSTWDESLPTDATLATLIDDHILDVRKGIRARMAWEHEWPASQASTAVAGQHKFLTLQNQATQPALAGTQVSALYIKTDGGTAYGLYFAAKSGNEVLVAGSGGVNVGTGAVIATTRYIVNTYAVGSNATPIGYAASFASNMGDQFFQFAYTPQASGNSLLVKVQFHGAANNSDYYVVGLFKDTDGACMALGQGGAGAVGYPQTIVFEHILTVTSTAAITFKVRASQQSTGYNIYFNGSSSQWFSGSAASGLIIQELKGLVI